MCPSSSGDRASASGAESRRFESYLGHHSDFPRTRMMRVFFFRQEKAIFTVLFYESFRFQSLKTPLERQICAGSHNLPVFPPKIPKLPYWYNHISRCHFRHFLVYRNFKRLPNLYHWRFTNCFSFYSTARTDISRYRVCYCFVFLNGCFSLPMNL